MNLEIIDKWLDNEFGVSYTRLEELHDFVIKQDLKHQEKADKEIERLNNIIDGMEKWLEEKQILYGINQQGFSWGVCGEALDKLQELKGSDK